MKQLVFSASVPLPTDEMERAKFMVKFDSVLGRLADVIENETGHAVKFETKHYSPRQPKPAAE